MRQGGLLRSETGKESVGSRKRAGMLGAPRDAGVPLGC